MTGRSGGASAVGVTELSRGLPSAESRAASVGTAPVSQVRVSMQFSGRMLTLSEHAANAQTKRIPGVFFMARGWCHGFSKRATSASLHVLKHERVGPTDGVDAPRAEVHAEVELARGVHVAARVGGDAVRLVASLGAETP